jgi:general secretion pathway protein C
MQLLSFARLARLQNAAAALMTLAAMTIFAVVAAYWSWEWLTPPLPGPTAVTQSEPQRFSSVANIFGVTEQESDSAHTTRSGTQIQLLGLLMATTANAHSYALLRVEPGPSIAIQEGEEITPGIQLAKIAIDHVIVERDGVREIFSWPSKK